MKSTSKFISDIIIESALDHRIADGVVNLKNAEHIQVIAERLYDAGLDEELVNEFVEQFVDEGKYPERQAYNKDGWLVTFPSKEYKDAAIKKKTHFASDPTHGKGGMNLYYKKRGKQKRQTQQDVSAAEPTVAQNQLQKKEPVQPTTQSQPAKKSKETPTATGLTPSEKERLAKVTGRSSEKPTTPAPATQEPAASTAAQQPPTAPAASDKDTATPAPAIDVPVVTQAPKEYASVSIKFAKQKGWVAEPYGEYKDAENNPVAVVGLSGEVVPIRNTDREEYKIFAEKNNL